MTREEAINHLYNDWYKALGGQICVDSDKAEKFLEALGMAFNALSAQQSNDPLTLDELREMNGEPVYCAELQCYGIIKVETIGIWANIPFLIGTWCVPNCGSAVNFEYDIESRGLTLYRHKPEEGQHETD